MREVVRRVLRILLAIEVRAVAQLGRAPASGAGGRGFKSHQPDKIASTKVLKTTGHIFLNEVAAKAFFQRKFQPGGVTQVQIPCEFTRMVSLAIFTKGRSA
jgi:hypothetical protein